jgi:hypothetical protein
VSCECLLSKLWAKNTRVVIYLRRMHALCDIRRFWKLEQVCVGSVINLKIFGSWSLWPYWRTCDYCFLYCLMASHKWRYLSQVSIISLSLSLTHSLTHSWKNQECELIWFILYSSRNCEIWINIIYVSFIHISSEAQGTRYLRLKINSQNFL